MHSTIISLCRSRVRTTQCQITTANILITHIYNANFCFEIRRPQMAGVLSRFVLLRCKYQTSTGNINKILMSRGISRFGIDALFTGRTGHLCETLAARLCERVLKLTTRLRVIFDAPFECAVTVPAFECDIRYALFMRAAQSQLSIVQFEFNQLGQFGLRYRCSKKYGINWMAGHFLLRESEKMFGIHWDDRRQYSGGVPIERQLSVSVKRKKQMKSKLIYCDQSDGRHHRTDAPTSDCRRHSFIDVGRVTETVAVKWYERERTVKLS